MPVIASTQEALRASSTSTSPSPRSNHSRARSASKRISSALISGRLRASEPAQVLGGQVDAAVLVVLAHVAQDVRQLHRDAEVVGQPRVRRCRCRR